MSEKRQIYVRFGVTDIVRTIEDYKKDPEYKPKEVELYFIGFEDEEGNELDRDEDDNILEL